MNTNDFVPAFDPTGYTSISGSALYQFLYGSYPSSDRGLVITTTDSGGSPEVPDAATNTKFQRYVWRRITASSAAIYIWNPNASTDVTFLKWRSIVEASIGPGTIINSMIADNTITDQKIVSLDYTKLINAPTNLPPSGAAGGDLTGTYPNPTIADNAVTTTKINDLAVTSNKIETASSISTGIPYTKLRSDGVAKDMLRAKADYTMEWFVPPVLFTSGVVVPTANALKIPQVNAGATDFQMVDPTTLGRVLQRSYLSTTNSYTSSTAVAPGAITGANGTDVSNLKVTNFVPISASSKIMVKVRGTFKKITNDGFCVIALFKVATGAAIDGSVNAVAAEAVYAGADANLSRVTSLQYQFDSGSTAGIDIAVKVMASSTGTLTFNPSSGYTPANQCDIEVIEYI